MKTIKIYICAFAVIGAIINFGCKKDSSTSNGLSSQQITQVQSSDSQDAIADKTDQDVDNTVDELQSNNYQPTSSKAASTSGVITITVDHPDSTTFPKVVKIVYVNFEDSTADENLIKNGEIDITIVARANNNQLFTRVHTFKNFSVSTDSTTLTINGSRTVIRTGHAYKFHGLQSLRVTATDSIIANLSYHLTIGSANDSFTRVAAKQRTAILHYINDGGLTWKTIKFRNALYLDTLNYTGTVAGINEKGESYTKTVPSITPLTVIFYKGTPVISSGTMSFIVGSASDQVSYTITFKEDPGHPHKTLITVTNDATQKTHSFDRRLSRKFTKWW